MHLKTLTLRGFKSFASQTTLHFEPGINCVVGPNGSGKSNVVDALAWVMGEQGAKNLRGGNMADVIFAGTASRQALGRAEVSLTIDNSDGQLPIDYSEVTITRTLFRAGGSEYAINGTTCRLLDIQELLSDTGMGRQMHVIIGQGRLDHVLTATPEERRTFIEEAAGVLKHRRRKEKALSKLESMQANLTRIDDLAAELRRQLGPLARQAATARRAQTIQQNVFDAKARLLADDLAQLNARLATQTANDSTIDSQREAAATAVTQARADVERCERDLAVLTPKLANLNDTWQEATALAERYSSLCALAEERYRSLSHATTPQHRGESSETLRERARTARAEEEQLRAAVQQAHDVLSAAITAREDAESAQRTCDHELAVHNRVVADRRETIARIGGKIATVTSKIEVLESERIRTTQAVTAAKERATSTENQINALEREAGGAPDDSLETQGEAAAHALATAKAELDKARAELTAAQANTITWRTKAETLQLSLAPEDATAWVFETQPGIRGLVRDSIRIEPGWEAGIETAMAGIADGAIIDDIDLAIDAIRNARERGAGHVEFLVGTADGTESESTEAITEAAGVEASQARSAHGLILGENQVARALRALLHDTIIVRDLGVARRVLRAGAQRVATVNGDLFTPTSARGGEAEHSALLAKQALYDDATRQAATAEENETRAREQVARAIEAQETAQTAYDHVAMQLAARDSRVAAITAQLGVLRQTAAAARADEARANEQLDRISGDHTALRAQQKLLQAEYDLYAEQPDDADAILRELNQRRDVAHQATIAARSAETDARLALRTHEERLRAIAGRADALDNTATNIERRIAQEQRAAQRRKEAAQIARNVHELAERAAEASRRVVTELTDERAECGRAHAQREADIVAARKTLEKALADERYLDDRRHQYELLLAEITLTYKQLADSALSETGMEAAILIEEYGPHRMVPDTDGDEPTSRPYVRAEQEKRLARSERDLARLGKINPLALEEHAALEERQRYLSEQLADLRQSRSDLLAIVKDIDARVHEVMTSAFADVAEQFTAIFARLFPGGEGKLVLTDPESILTTGIDIEARPPGKRVKRLSLLSGGERSLTAVAFLIAIFMARPSPFYVMDEVEAALDDVNLQRLLGIFSDLKHTSQLLVITHHKRTMEIADALYGVAMRESGVTSVISQRIDDVRPT